MPQERTTWQSAPFVFAPRIPTMVARMAAQELIESHGGVGVALRGVERRFDDGTVVFRGINLDVKPGDFVALLGPSGCGKSTLLRLVAGLDRPQGGAVNIERRSGPAVDRADIAYVFQDAHLL